MQQRDGPVELGPGGSAAGRGEVDRAELLVAGGRGRMGGGMLMLPGRGQRGQDNRRESGGRKGAQHEHRLQVKPIHFVPAGSVSSSAILSRMTQPATAAALPANVRVFEMAAAVVAARALWGAAEFGVADALDNDPRPVTELAATCGADPGALYRVLRLLAAHGVFVEHDGRRFSHSEMSRTLRSDHPTRTRAAVRMLCGDGMYRAFGALRESIATGGPPGT